MKHCKKLGGRSPSVETKTEWENLVKETKAVGPDPSKLPAGIWLQKEALELSLRGLTIIGQKEFALKKVCGETTTLEDNWKTIQNRGRPQIDTKMRELTSTASFSSPYRQKQEQRLSMPVKDALRAFLAHTRPLLLSI